MKTYSFDVQHAEKYGVNEAIMIYNFQFWISKNMANNKHLHDGRYWTYNSMRAFAELFPFWNERQVKYILKSLIDKNILMKGNHSPNAYDRTAWYAFVDESEFLGRKDCKIEKAEKDDALDKSVQCNTDNKPDNKPYSKRVKKNDCYFEETGIYKIPDEWKAWCREKHPAINPDYEFEKFSNFWLSVASNKARKRDWFATYRNWIINSAKSNTANKNQAVAVSKFRKVL